MERAGDVTITRVEHDGEHVRVSTLQGPGERDFVLVSGIGVASDYYIRLALDLNAIGSVHSIDLPGFAGVRHSGRPLAINDFADLTEAVLDHLGIEDPVLVGHSMGSQVVTEVAARRRGISHAVLIGPVVNAAERTVVQQGLRLLTCAGREPIAITVHVLASYVLCGPRWFFTVLPHMMRYPIEDRLPAVGAHTLLLRGQHDGNAPRGWVARLADLTPHARAWEIPGAAHSVMYAHAREVAQLCVEHLGRPEGEREGEAVHRGGKDGSANGERRLRGEIAARVSGTLLTLRGMVHDDDALVAEGSRRQLEARRRENARVNAEDAATDAARGPAADARPIAPQTGTGRSAHDRGR